MKKFRLPFLIFILVTSQSGSAAFRNECRRITSCIAQVFLNGCMHNYSGAELPVTKDGVRFILHPRRRRGAGFSSSVYDVSADEVGVRVPPGLGIVAKIPHSLIFFSPAEVPLPFSVKENEAEYKIWDTIQTNITKIESEAVYPEDHAWEKGKAPIIPILSKLEGFGGTILIKPYVGKQTLKYLLGKHKTLPLAMAKSLKDLYAFNDSLKRSVNGPTDSAKPLELDVKHSNIVWVTDPVLKKLMGLKRDSFVFLEASERLTGAVDYELYK